jgi:hypothetical protein
MTVVEDLLLRLRTSGASESASSVDRVRKSVKSADETAKHASKSHDALGKSIGGLTGIARNAAGLIGIGGLAMGLGDAIKNAETFQESQAQLGASIKANVHAPARDATAQMGEFADSLSTRGGFNPTQNINAMTQFLRITHDTTKAQSDATLATNIARGAHVDYGRAVRAVTMLEQGRVTGLSKLGISVKPVTSAVDELRATHKHVTAEQLAQAKATDALATKQGAMAIVSKQYSGAMSTYSHTAAGGLANFRNAIEVLSTKLGAVLLPIITKVASWFTAFIGQMESGKGAGGKFVDVLKDVASWLGEVWKWIKQNKDWLEFLAAAVGGMVIAYKAWEIATNAVKAAQVALNAVSDMNPWVLAIGAVIGVVILLYTRFKWFRDFVKGAMHVVSAAIGWIKNAAVNVFSWIKNNWPLVVGLLTGPFGLAIAEIVKHWDQVKKLPGELLHTLESVGKDIANAIAWPFKWAFNWISKHMPHVSFHSHHVGPVSIPLPSISFGASGGFVTQSGPFIVGERGPELLHLPRGSNIVPNDRLGAALGGGEQTIIIYNMLDGQRLSKSVIRQGLLQQSRGG